MQSILDVLRRTLDPNGLYLELNHADDGTSAENRDPGYFSGIMKSQLTEGV